MIQNLAQFSAVPAPIILGTAIRSDSEGRVSLNDLHTASGSDPNKRPAQFLRTGPAKEYIRGMTDAHICASPLQTVKGGSSQGSYAHELLAMEYARWISAPFAIHVNQVFLELHRTAQRPVLPSLPDTLRLAADLAEQNADQAKQLEAMCPKALALDRLAQTEEGDVTPTEAAKFLQVQRQQLFEWLYKHRWIYRSRDHRNRRWQAYDDKRRQGLLKHKFCTVDGSNGDRRDVAQLMITRKGLTRIAELMERGS